MAYCNRHFRNRGSASLTAGILLTVMGVFFLMENLDVIYVDDLSRYWPVLLIVIGFVRLIGVFRMPRAASN